MLFKLLDQDYKDQMALINKSQILIFFLSEVTNRIEDWVYWILQWNDSNLRSIVSKIIIIKVWLQGIKAYQQFKLILKLNLSEMIQLPPTLYINIHFNKNLRRSYLHFSLETLLGYEKLWFCEIIGTRTSTSSSSLVSSNTELWTFGKRISF